MGNLIIKKRANDSRAKQVVVNSKRNLKDAEEVEDLLEALTPEELQDLKELLPYKEALIKIAKGEFEIERIIEEDDEDEDMEEMDFDEETLEEDDTDIEEDEDLAADDEDLEADEDDTDMEDSDEDVNMEDSEAINDAWRKRLNGDK